MCRLAAAHVGARLDTSRACALWRSARAHRRPPAPRRPPHTRTPAHTAHRQPRHTRSRRRAHAPAGAGHRNRAYIQLSRAHWFVCTSRAYGTAVVLYVLEFYTAGDSLRLWLCRRHTKTLAAAPGSNLEHLLRLVNKGQRELL